MLVGENDGKPFRSACRRGGSLRAAITLAAAIAMSAMILAACGGSGRTQTNRSRLTVFDNCVSHTDFLVLIHHAAKRSIIETIKDRSRADVVGEVATAASDRILGEGADAGTPRYLMSTATPLGRDATAIENCWDRFSPIAP